MWVGVDVGVYVCMYVFCVCVCVTKSHITARYYNIILVSPLLQLQRHYNRKNEGMFSSVCVFSSHSFWTLSSLDVPAGVTQEEGHTGF